MLSNFKLATKFSLLLSLVFISAIFFSGLILSHTLEQKAQAEISYRGQLLTQMINSVREYTAAHITPQLEPKLDDQSGFISESIPSFAAREVFENLRTHQAYQNFLYKDATLNPTNLRDKADEFERDLIDRFQTQPELKTLSGFRTVLGEKLFYSAQPFAIKNASCLRCHSTPAAAPKSHLASYGQKNGFGWQLYDILGAQIIYVPATAVFDSAHQAFSMFISIFVGIFAVVIVLINSLIKQEVIQPIKPMAQAAEKLSTDTMSYEEAQQFEREGLGIIVKRNDELGQLGRVFRRMIREVYAREQSLKQQMQALRIEIDQSKRFRQVAEVTETENFQKLRQEAQDIRSTWQETEE